MPRLLRAASAGALAALLASSASAQTIDTRVGATGSGFFETGHYNGGVPYAPELRLVYTVGQLFTVPVGFSTLDQFSVWLQPGINPGVLSYRAYVTGWDATNLRPDVGDVRWTSSTVAGPAGPSYTGYQEFAFHTGGVNLIDGGLFVAFISSIELPTPGYDGQTLKDMIRMVGSDSPDGPYAGGGLVHAQTWTTNGELSDLTSPNDGYPEETSWEYRPYQELAFTAGFSEGTVTPEPATLALLGTGLLGMGAARRRRARREPPAA